jgi:hypothetical protein
MKSKRMKASSQTGRNLNNTNADFKEQGRPTGMHRQQHARSWKDARAPGGTSHPETLASNNSQNRDKYT